jgi:predicted outer membrane repeat protein
MLVLLPLQIPQLHVFYFFKFLVNDASPASTETMVTGDASTITLTNAQFVSN